MELERLRGARLIKRRGRKKTVSEKVELPESRPAHTLTLGGAMDESNKILPIKAVPLPDRRDYFAMAALTGLLSEGRRSLVPKEAAEQAKAYADALIKELDSEVQRTE
jgi:hypothetical protein